MPPEGLFWFDIFVFFENFQNCERFFDNICIINGKCITFFVFSILEKISTGYSFFVFGFPLKICAKKVKSNI